MTDKNIAADIQLALIRLDSCNAVERYRARRYLRNKMPHLDEALDLDGGPGSGNWGHVGRPGKKGGSGGGGGRQFR